MSESPRKISRRDFLKAAVAAAGAAAVSCFERQGRKLRLAGEILKLGEIEESSQGKLAEESAWKAPGVEAESDRGNKTAYVAIVGQGLRWRDYSLPDGYLDDPFPQRSVDLSEENLAAAVGSTKEKMIDEKRMWTVVPSGEEDTDFDAETKLVYDAEDQQSVEEMLVRVRDEVLRNTEVGNIFIYVTSHGGFGGESGDGRLWIGKAGIRFEDFNKYLASFTGLNVMAVIEACYSGMDAMPYFVDSREFGGSMDQNPVSSAQGYSRDRFIFTTVSNAEQAVSGTVNDFSKPIVSEIFFDEMLKGGTLLDMVRRTNERVSVIGTTPAAPATTFTRINEDGWLSTIFGMRKEWGGVDVEMDFPKTYGSDSLGVRLDWENGQKVIRNTSEITSTLVLSGGGMAVVPPGSELVVSEEITRVVTTQGAAAMDLNTGDDKKEICVVGGFKSIGKGENEQMIVVPIANVCGEAKEVEVLYAYNHTDTTDTLTPDSVWLKSVKVRLEPNSVQNVEIPFNVSTVMNVDQGRFGFPMIISVGGTVVEEGEEILTGPLLNRPFLPYKIYLPSVRK